MGNNILENNITITSAYKLLKNKGNLVYEYNPFRNYRLTTEMFEYKNGLYSFEDLRNLEILALQYTTLDEKEYKWYPILTAKKLYEVLATQGAQVKWTLHGKDMEVIESPILRRPGEIVNFETSELQFDFEHPVTIDAQYSYDNSVNLIFNDGKREPRLINSRFSATEKNQYQIVDRVGNSDTNLYDQGDQFDIDTSLLKKTKAVPKVTYNGTFAGGCMPIGNYHFYFKYADADGNETDFIAESGLTSVFIGTNPYNIRTGVREENSNKGVSFTLKNLDPGYQYVSVFYTKNTGDILQESTVNAYKLLNNFMVTSLNTCYIKITGFEEIKEVPLIDINLKYQIFQNAKTQAICQNRLFLGNIQTITFDNVELQDISLRFCPYYKTEEYVVSDKISEEYDIKSDYNNSYYNSKFIYDKVGYWPGEIYRFGIVYIGNDGSLSPVYNVRGIQSLPSEEDTKIYHSFVFKQDGRRVNIPVNEETNLLIVENNTDNPENSKGVVKIPESGSTDIYSIGFKIDSESAEIINHLKTLGIRSFFFVRQRRIPTILGQGFTIGVDKHSHTPVIPYDNKFIAEGFLSKEKPRLSHDYENRTHELSISQAINVALFPEYDVDSAYLNNIFGGDDFQIVKVANSPLMQSKWNKRYYYNNTPTNSDYIKAITKIQGVEDDQLLSAIDQTFFAARAGDPAEVRKFEFIGRENKKNDATNLVRGSFGPFLGMDKCPFYSSIINIYIPGYHQSNLSTFFTIRYNDKSEYLAISERMSLDEIDENETYFRGDCYICQFTHRINRNFQDSAAPTNDKIIDPKCWDDNFKYTDGVLKKDDLTKINLGDVNAIQLGQWVTFVIRSTKNLNIRTIDESNVEESLRFGHPRGYYPYLPLSARGVYKTAEALCYNKGFEKSVSERWNNQFLDAPYYTNEFSNRISFSNVSINSANYNGLRVFSGDDYQDYPKTYGSITRLIEISGNLLCVFEHGVAIIPVKERIVTGEGAGGTATINSEKVLPETLKPLSDIYGSQWPDSVIKTATAVYGVDTVARKIWRTDGSSFKCISDSSVQEFLNNNISLTERELTPVIGVRNVKTHHNKYKDDIIFTFYDNLYGHEEKAWSLCWNERLSTWVTFYSWMPSYSENIHNQFYSFDRNTSKYITKLGLSVDDTQNVYLENNIIDTGQEWGTKICTNITDPNITYTSSIEYDSTQSHKLFKIDNNILSFIGDYEGDLCSELYVRQCTVPLVPIAINTDYTSNYNNPTTYYWANEDLKEETYLIDNPGNRLKTSAQTLDRGLKQLPIKYVEYQIIDSITYICWELDDEGNEINYGQHKVTSKDQENWLKDEYTVTDKNGVKHTNYSRLFVNNNIPGDFSPRIAYKREDKEYYQCRSTVYRWSQRDMYLKEKGNLKVYKRNGIRVPLDYENALNPDKLVQFIKVKVQLYRKDKTEELSLGYTQQIDCGYYDAVLAVIPAYNMQFLTTDFWKHGQAGIIDIADKIRPTYWYGKQHPFEFEFVVAAQPNIHKIFDNLEIISNKAAPESFHYEIVGECYDFAKDKKNMYIRQEALKELYQYNGINIAYDHDYKELDSTPEDIQGDSKYYAKSTIFPAYYARQDSTTNIEDKYHIYGRGQYGKDLSKNYARLSGSEIVRYDNLNEFRIWNHVKATNLAEEGLRNGNMMYKEDKWQVQIPSINYVQKNEEKSDWKSKYSLQDTSKIMVPAELNLFKVESDIPKDRDSGNNVLQLPDDWERNIVKWANYDTNFKEAKMKDKYIKIRIRYSGEDLAIISAIYTLYSLSYA